MLHAARRGTGARQRWCAANKPSNAGVEMKRIWMTALALAAICLGPCSAFAQGAVQLSFATAAPGAAWNNYSVGMAELIKAKLPAGSDVQLKIGPGAIFSINLVQSGKADIGFGFAHT